jgi:hypothetical protein
MTALSIVAQYEVIDNPQLYIIILDNSKADIPLPYQVLISYDLYLLAGDPNNFKRLIARCEASQEAESKVLDYLKLNNFKFIDDNLLPYI